MNIDCLSNIFKYLSISAIYNCFIVSKLFNYATNNDFHWKSLYEDTFGKYYRVGNYIYKNDPSDANKPKYEYKYYTYNDLKSYKAEYKDFYILNEFIYKIYRGQESLNRMRKLTGALYLSNIRISSIPPEIFKLNNFTKLYLNNNHLEYIPPEIGQMRNLVQLDLSHNKLKSIPKELYNLCDLTTFDLSHNNLDSLPDGIIELLWLEILNLSYNQFKLLPKDLELMHRLRWLQADNNKLESITIRKKLRTLTLHNNKLKTIPKVNLFGLDTIYFNNNLFESLPKQIDCMIDICEIGPNDDIFNQCIFRNTENELLNLKMFYVNYNLIKETKPLSLHTHLIK